MIEASAAAPTRVAAPVLIDAHDIGQRQTGNETWIRNVSRELAKHIDANSMTWATSREGRDIVRTLTRQEPSVVADSSVRRLALDLPHIARRSRAGVILVQYTMPLTQRPCVVMVHDLSPFHPAANSWLTFRTASRIRHSIRHSARRAAVVLAPSEFTRGQLIERFGRDPDRVVVSVNAVDPDLAAALSRVKRQREDDGFVVLTVGNVVPRKNLPVVARAVDQLRRKGVDIKLRIVGTVPPNGRAHAQAITALLGPAVALAGHVSMAELAQEYANADVFAFPSLFEGFGIPALEAMAAGLPVVASDQAALPEVVGNAGVLLPADDHDAWANAFRTLHANRALYDESAAQGRARAASYTWHESTCATVAALNRALEQG